MARVPAWYRGLCLMVSVLSQLHWSAISEGHRPTLQPFTDGHALTTDPLAFTAARSCLPNAAKVSQSLDPSSAIVCRLTQVRQLLREKLHHSGKFMFHRRFPDSYHNAGDTCHSVETRRIFDAFLGPFVWKTHHYHYGPLTSRMLGELNRDGLGIVVGGGGLISHRERTESGWMLDFPTSMIASIQPPFFIFAIGVNAMYVNQPLRSGQDQRLARNLQALQKKVTYLSLRNHRSVEYVQSLAGKHDNIVFQPDPTTMLPYFGSEYMSDGLRNGGKKIAVSVALKDLETRVGGNPTCIKRIFDGLHAALRELKANRGKLHWCVIRLMTVIRLLSILTSMSLSLRGRTILLYGSSTRVKRLRLEGVAMPFISPQELVVALCL
eukprot:jgi/Mesvir1/23766/Mv26304-RA.2